MLKAKGRKVDGFNLGVGNYNTQQELALFRDVGMKVKPDIIVLLYFINNAEPMQRYDQISWLEEHSEAWVVLNYRIDALRRQYGVQPDWRHYYRNLYNEDAPGWIKTSWGESASAAWQERALRETPLARWGTPVDVAHAARFLVSPDAAFLTGQVLRVNGGAVR